MLFHCRYDFPMEYRCGLALEKVKFPYTQGCIVPTLVEIGQLVLEKKKKCEKFTGDQKSSFERSAQMS